MVSGGLLGRQSVSQSLMENFCQYIHLYVGLKEKILTGREEVHA